MRVRNPRQFISRRLAACMLIAHAASIENHGASGAVACIMDEEQIKRRIIELQTEHRDLDEAIERLSHQPGVDDLRLRRLKKRRLMLRDCIARLQMELVPDIPA